MILNRSEWTGAEGENKPDGLSLWMSDMAGRSRDAAQSITTAPEEKVAELLKKMDELLKADAVAETKAASGKARDEVQSALARGAGKR